MLTEKQKQIAREAQTKYPHNPYAAVEAVLAEQARAAEQPKQPVTHGINAVPQVPQYVVTNGQWAQPTQQPAEIAMYRKTALIGAAQFLPREGKIPDGVISDGNGDPRKDSRFSWIISTLENNVHYVSDGDWIATGIQGEHWAIKPDVFAATYELVKPAEQTPAGDASIGLIAAERERQIKGEGWTLEHDDAHKYGELAAAASCYAHHANCQIRKFQPSYIKNRPSGWPWDAKWWKPSAFPVHNLVKAGALIVAELDRLARLAKPAEQERVAVKHVDGFWAVEVGVMQRASFLWADDAERYAAGLREELKAGKQ
jgi:hypothetical protein